MSKDKHYGYSYYKVPPNWAAIASEIYLRGSVTLTYKVYEDFVSYKSGKFELNNELTIYRHDPCTSLSQVSTSMHMENSLVIMQLKYLDGVMKEMFHTGKMCTIIIIIK